MKRKKSTAIWLLVLLVGCSLLLYPTISNQWNAYHQSRVIVDYAQQASGMDAAVKQEILENARSYNQELAEKSPHWVLTESEWANYESQLDVSGTGIMGYVEIPKIDCSLALYHGTEESVLSVGVGHIEGSSLPVGGESTHAVFSGHRGLPSAKLFSDLDRMETGDVFYLHVLEETLTYEVDQIVTVLPDELESLEIEKGEDLCTLVTCTPYGINSHRLLVRGHRIPTPVESANSEMQEMDSPHPSVWKIVLSVGLPAIILTALLVYIVLCFAGRNRKRRRRPKHLKRK